MDNHILKCRMKLRLGYYHDASFSLDAPRNPLRLFAKGKRKKKKKGENLKDDRFKEMKKKEQR